MGNMSYCRFQNTLGDLQDCARALRQADDLPGQKRSPREFEAMVDLVKLCTKIAEEFEGVDLVTWAQDQADEDEDCERPEGLAC